MMTNNLVILPTGHSASECPMV